MRPYPAYQTKNPSRTAHPCQTSASPSPAAPSSAPGRAWPGYIGGGVHCSDAYAEVLAFGEKAAVHSGQIRAELARRGTPIGPYDVMIAGHARSEGLVVVSNNVREFERVEGLRVENWLGG